MNCAWMLWGVPVIGYSFFQVWLQNKAEHWAAQQPFREIGEGEAKKG